MEQQTTPGPASDGGPAFPQQELTGEFTLRQIGGMTLRDHFAGLAMQALLMAPDEGPWPCGIDPQAHGDDEWRQTDYMATAAYIYADAMLRARATGASHAG